MEDHLLVLQETQVVADTDFRLNRAPGAFPTLVHPGVVDQNCH